MKRLIPILVLAVAGCNAEPVPTYEQLVNWKLSCKLKHEQFPKLERIQKQKNFSKDIDELSPTDRAYNAILREHMWWFVYNCEQ